MQDDTTDWYGPEAATFGDRLAAARDQAGMTQTDLAKRLGVKLSTLKKWEDDLLEPRANRLSIMAGVLNVSLVWLLTGEGEGVSDPDDTDLMTPDINDLLIELREMKATMKANAEKLGRLEKKLRLKLSEAVT
ncbi:MAG: helix-turn-helix transcriptional regulator [Marinovum algicola]|jgi:transcriptional regulator with XRE-family HTH domain|uniref:Helix-turn-helix domain-containing protein n=1 Tax=Marinovum algicola TaxID=42444 RepID=A0A975W6C3_9RHOB|nr:MULTISPECIES: helix-turn-helix transcriptional regulator [Marinovum]AKO95899.1 putative transcription factor, similar to eukaryotic MBF1 [Marinovum algicola DG 898]MDD9741112.1 helix-turn-helix transcriptional regulator [Marinovum sp. SP66]MDD9742666.1 helix-turn-helix transcriptional regulator [Marinovum sp. PR37]SEI57740.1 Helix-turn-helix domain-containing protein [Marinovum algicola]SLN27944.1 HTH-type transcriptional regulator ImmR [Marinovum algicola]